MRFTPGFGMKENVKVATSNSFAPAFEMPVPAVDLKFCGLAFGKLPAVSGAKLALPVLSTMPLDIPRFDPEAVNVPATVAELPLANTGVPVSVIPGLAAAMVEANVAALVVLVTVIVALAVVAKVTALMKSAANPTIQSQNFAIVLFDFERTTKPTSHIAEKLLQIPLVVG